MTLVLDRAEVARLLDLDACIAAVEDALAAHAAGRALPARSLGVPSRDGGFHVKAAGLRGPRPYFAAKCNGNFPANPERTGRPAIQGVIVLCDAVNGEVLALMDSIEITIQRTGAATAAAARRLAPEGPVVATVCGCGNQGRVQLRALARVRPLRHAYAWDRDPERARALAAEMARELDVEVHAVEALEGAPRESDVWITCTPARVAFLAPAHVRPGAFVAAVGADSPDKQELEPALLASAAVVVDSLEQCAAYGDLHHAIAAGLLRAEDIRAELPEVVSGARPGRLRADEILVFDSTGTALLDVAAAALVYERARAAGAGRAIDLAG